MNEIEIDRLAAAANALRPDWPIKSLRTLLSGPRLVGKPRRDVAVALAWIACETATTTPARVLEAGPWWRAAAVDSTSAATTTPPKRDESCLTCGRRLEACTCGEQRRRPSRPADDQARAHGLAACQAAIDASRHTPAEEDA